MIRPFIMCRGTIAATAVALPFQGDGGAPTRGVHLALTGTPNSAVVHKLPSQGDSVVRESKGSQ